MNNEDGLTQQIWDGLLDTLSERSDIATSWPKGQSAFISGSQAHW